MLAAWPRSPWCAVVALMAIGCGAAGPPIAAGSDASPRAPSPTPTAAGSVTPSVSPREDATPSAPRSASTPPPPPPRGVVRFACDDKYEQTPRCDEAKWLASIADDPFSHDLLVHDAGGPSGAVWNGDAPMFIVTREPAKRASIGGVALSPVAATRLRVFRSSSATWRRALRPSQGHPYSVAPVEIDGVKLGELWFAEGE